ncbi:MAG: hypothetical protein CMJ49_14535 [Planctomycetaceae bacterium]|nr:hypothetical protein [Planctomycetaceae bacterium]
MFIISTIGKLFTKMFGSRNDRVVKGYYRRVVHINALEPEIRPLTDKELKQRTADLRQRVADGTNPADVLYEAFAIMREATDRNIGIRNIFNPELKDQFDVSKLPGSAQTLYERTAKEIENTPPAEVLGSEELVPGWLQVDISPHLYEAVRELYPESKPPFRARPFDVQLIGGMVLQEGNIAEMKTGEGKTIVAPLACFMACVANRRCHVVTVNDYLVQRDRDWVFPAYYKLGLTVGAIHPPHMLPREAKQKAYECDVVYGTNSEFGFDHLRDNMALGAQDQVQKHRHFCIVDEIDNILIDEARTPLIISGQAHDDAPQYQQANNVADQLAAKQRSANQDTTKRLKREGFVAEQARLWRANEAAIEKIVAKYQDLGPDYLDDKEAEQIEHVQYYVVKREQKQAYMTPLGVEEAQNIIGTRFYVVGNDMAWDHLINQALRAHCVYEADREYVVKDGEVVIVDEFTGRLMVGRQWSDGLHQAIEAKEARHGVKIKKETQTVATITIQNFFKLYDRLAGMTGTALTEVAEFHDIYGLDVVAIPTNRPVTRDDQDDLIFLTEKAKWDAIIEEIKDTCEAGQPVLVGTTSVDKSDMLSTMLTKKYGIDHEVLNAKNHAREATIIAKAGEQHVDARDRTIGNVMIATNMAGRGTDIKLAPAVREQGLRVIGTERHEARRIDNQLRGRSGRQGDPGSSRFFISMEDDLMKMFAGKTTMKALSMLGMQEDDAIEHRWVTKSVERAQRKVEERNYQARKNLLEYDEVMEHQRNTFYGTRQTVLEGRDTEGMVLDYIAEAVEDAVGRFIDPLFGPERAAEMVKSILGTNMDATRLRGDSLEEVEPRIRNDAKAEARQEIETTLGEYMSNDMDPDDWDVKGLSQWAMSRFSVDLKQRRIRESTPQDVLEELTEVAHELMDRRPLDALAEFYDPGYTGGELADWVQKKFGIEIEATELQTGRNESPEGAQQRIAELVYDRAAEAYRQREVEYPVQFELDMISGAAGQSEEGGAWAADQLATWARQRYALDWTADSVQKQTADQIQEELFAAARDWSNGQLEHWVHHTLRDNPNDDLLAERFSGRFVRPLDVDRIAEADDRADALRDQARGVLRTELTQLERFVLLQILDQTWKDHLYAMDQLKDSIGLQAFAERDPKIQYKTEGARMFVEMQRSVRDQVTDLIYKARLTADFTMRDRYGDQTASHDTAETTGVSAAAAAADAGTAAQRADLEAAQRAGGGRAVTQTIKRNQPKVGRNDPCPCGSGKKFKQCCGRS